MSQFAEDVGGGTISDPQHVDFATAEFELRREPFIDKLVSEDYVNERFRQIARQTDHAMLTPLPAPAARDAQFTYAATERPWGYHDPSLTGAKVDIDPVARFDPLQDMNAYEAYHVNTFRIEPEPWDADLIEGIR